MVRFVRLHAIACLAAMAAGCGGGDPASQPSADRAPVEWPALKALDALAEDGAAQADLGPLPEIRTLAGKLKAAAEQVAADPVPAGATRPDSVAVLQQDLKSLVAGIADPATMADAELRPLLRAIHPIVEKLMEDSGLPHEHGEEHEHP